VSSVQSQIAATNQKIGSLTDEITALRAAE
jgi:hypothetical protein